MKKVLLAAMAMLFAVSMNAQRPSIQNILNLYDSKSQSAFTNLGFSLIDKKTQIQEDEYGDGTFTVAKEVYKITYKISNSVEGNMTITCVSQEGGIGSPTMEIKCDVESWSSLKREAASLKRLNSGDDNSYWISEGNLILNFKKSGLINISEAEVESVSWNERIPAKTIKKATQLSNTRVLTDLISFKDIINTNGDLSSFFRTHGFKEFEYQAEGGMRFSETVYYKNCVVRNNEIVPYGNGTSIRIRENGTMTATQYTIEVFNSTAYNQLINDFLNYAKKTSDGYEFYWSDGHVSKFAFFEENSNKKGGFLLITVPFFPYEEQ